ncbi:MAG: hypothetical protein HOI34_01025 [Rhodospirillaceae bacterium]|nr:hypothetical protein [Rhodospirillaceae bacterium]
MEAQTERLHEPLVDQCEVVAQHEIEVRGDTASMQNPLSLWPAWAR